MTGSDRHTIVQRQEPLDVGHIALHVRRNVGRRRCYIIFIPQMPCSTQDGVDVFDHVNRQAHCTRLVHNCALDCLSYPPGRISREAETALGIELLDGVDQPEVAFFDQIEERQASINITARDLDNETQVALDHSLARCFVAGLRAPRKLLLFVRS